MAKKLLSLVLVVCMAMSLSIVPVNAGAPVVLDGATKVMFEQSFGGLSGASDLTDFTVPDSGWNYMAGFMIADGGSRSVMTKANYDVSDAAQWIFTSKQSCTYNGYYLKLAYDEANSKGYVLAYSRATKKLALFRDTGYGYGAADVAKAVATASIDAYNTDTTITVTYTKATNTLKVSNSKNSNVIEYTPTDGYVPSLNGKFGVEGANAGVFTLFNMSLVKSYDSVTVDQWRYDKTFTASNTQAELEADGFTFSKATTPNDSGLSFNGKEFTFGPNGKEITGDYYFETKLKRQYNSYTLDFNKSENSYYRIWYGVNDESSAKNKPWIKLIKYDASTSATHDLVVINKESGLSAPHTRTYKGTVKTLDDGSVDINIGIYNGSTLEYTLAYTDTATDTVEVTTTTPVVDENGDPVYEEDGVTQKTTKTTENIDTGAPLTSGKLKLDSNGTGTSYMYYLKAYSIMSEDEQESGVTYSEDVINKTFTGTDTEESIETEGFTFRGQTSKGAYITTYPPSFSDTNGIYKDDKSYEWNLFYTNADAINGTYSFETDIKRNQNNADIYFNRKDDKNCYVLKVNNHNSRTFSIVLEKIVNGTTYKLKTLAGPFTTSTEKKALGNGVWINAKISLTEDKVNNNLTIDVTFSPTGRIQTTGTYIDTLTDLGEDGVDNGAPITSGNSIRIYQGYGNAYYKTFKLTKYVNESSTNGEEPVFIGRFSNDTGAIKEISKGNIYFEYPTALFGKYTVVAALYEDYKMTELKTFKPIDLYAGKIKLFDTTNSTAEDMKVRVYFFDGGETLNLVADEVYELN